MRPRAFRSGATGDEQRASSRWPVAGGTRPGGGQRREGMGEQGSAGRWVGERSFDGRRMPGGDSERARGACGEARLAASGLMGFWI